MQTFHEQTAAVIEHYRAQGRFAEVDGTLAIESVTQAIGTELHRLTKAGPGQGA